MQKNKIQFECNNRKLRIIFILFIYVTLTQQYDAVEIDCFLSYLYKAFFKDEVVGKYPEERDELSKIVEEGFSQVLDHLKKCHPDEDPLKKCDIQSDSHVQSSKQLVQDAEILSNAVEKPACITSNYFNFQPVTNIKLSTPPNSVNSLSNSYFIAISVLLLVALLFTAGLVSFLFFKNIQILAQKTKHLDEEKRDLQEPVTSNTEICTHQSEDGSRISMIVWTPEEAFHYLKRLAETVTEEYPDSENVNYLSDEFLTTIANFIVDQRLFDDLTLITPHELLDIAQFYYENLKRHDRRKHQKVHVIVNYDGKQTTNFERVQTG